MTRQRFTLDARVTSDNPAAIKPVLEKRFGEKSITFDAGKVEYRVHAAVEGPSARDLNRSVLSELRRTEKRTRLRADWTSNGVTERFFDYVPKGVSKG